MNLKPDELKMLESSKTVADWATACDLLAKARGGAMPPDWDEKVVRSGLADRMRNKWFIDRQVAPAGPDRRISPRNGRIALRLSEKGLQQTQGGIVMADADASKHKLVQGIVIAVDPDIACNATDPSGNVHCGRVEVNDLVLIHHNVGFDIRDKDGKDIRFVDYSAIYAVLEEAKPTPPPALPAPAEAPNKGF